MSAIEQHIKNTFGEFENVRKEHTYDCDYTAYRKICPYLFHTITLLHQIPICLSVSKELYHTDVNISISF